VSFGLIAIFMKWNIFPSCRKRWWSNRQRKLFMWWFA